MAELQATITEEEQDAIDLDLYMRELIGRVKHGIIKVKNKDGSFAIKPKNNFPKATFLNYGTQAR